MGFMDIVGVERPLLLIARVDAEDLWIEQVHALWAFVEEGLVRAAASAAVEGKMWFDEGICERFFAGGVFCGVLGDVGGGEGDECWGVGGVSCEAGL